MDCKVVSSLACIAKPGRKELGENYHLRQSHHNMVQHLGL